MNGEVRHLVVSGHIAGMERGVTTAIDSIIALVTAVLRPWMKQDPIVQAVNTDGEYDVNDNDAVRLRIAQAIRELPETCRAVVVLLCKWRFERTVNFLSGLDLGHSDLTVVFACSNDRLTAKPKLPISSSDTSRLNLKLCTEAAPDLPPGLYFVPRVYVARELVRIETGQEVWFDVCSDQFLIR